MSRPDVRYQVKYPHGFVKIGRVELNAVLVVAETPKCLRIEHSDLPPGLNSPFNRLGHSFVTLEKKERPGQVFFKDFDSAKDFATRKALEASEAAEQADLDAHSAACVIYGQTAYVQREHSDVKGDTICPKSLGGGHARLKGTHTPDVCFICGQELQPETGI